MKSFHYNLPTKIICGDNSETFFINDLKKLSFKKVLVLTGEKSSVLNGNLKKLSDTLDKVKLSYTIESSCPRGPDFEYLSYISRKIFNSFDCIIALGGGSVIDCAKGAALQSANLNSNTKLSALGDCRNFLNATCKVVAIPTTIGTGSEGNGTFIINDICNSLRRDFFHLSIRPCIAWLDPKYVLTLDSVSVENGLIDAVAHLLEQYFSSDDELMWNDYQIIGLLQYCIKCYKSLSSWDTSEKIRSEIQIVSLISMSYFLSQGKTISWSLHKKKELMSISNDSHASLIRTHLPAWLDDISLNNKFYNRIENINFIFDFVDNIR